MDLLKGVEFKASVSSVLNKDVKQYGKQFMFDSKEDTGWSSSEGSPQWILIRFSEAQTISGFNFQFQGGFAAKSILLVIQSPDGVTTHEEQFYPEDVNATQSFKLKSPITAKIASSVKFVFDSSTDFFGRIIVYSLEIFS